MTDQALHEVRHRALKQAWRFTWAHRIHVLLCIPALIGVTVLHEAAHAVAVLLQGATVTDFSILPSDGLWGYVTWAAPQSGLPHPHLASLAPYIMWTAMAATASFAAFIPARKPFWLASTFFVWFYAVPVLDIANNIASYALHVSGDLAEAFSPAPAIRITIAAIGAVAYGMAGYPVQRRLYDDAIALSPEAYALMCLLSMLGLALLRLA
jgi:hypothetical protein